jgi:hypothetical protein
LGDYLKNLLNAHSSQAMPMAEKAAYGLAIIFGVRHVIVKAFYALKRLRADMNLGSCFKPFIDNHGANNGDQHQQIHIGTEPL